jgi:hypothetical protein
MRRLKALPVLLTLFITSCISPQEYQAYKAEALAQQTTLDARLDDLRTAQAAAIETGNIEVAQRYQEKIDFTEKLHGGVDNAMVQLDKIVDEQGQFRQPEEIITAFDPILPVGVGSIGFLVVGLLRSLGKQKEWKKDFAALVAGIEDTKKDDAEFAAAMHKAGESLRSRLPSSTKAKAKALRS